MLSLSMGKPAGPAWSQAQEQYDYFSNLPGNKTVMVSSGAGIAAAANLAGIQAGDLLYFENSSGIIHHATIITKVEDHMIYFAGHTRSRYDHSLLEAIGNETVYIVMIGD